MFRRITAVAALGAITALLTGAAPAAVQMSRLAASLQQRQQEGNPTDYSRVWQSWGEVGRTAYVLGFMEGEINGVIDSTDWFRGKIDARTLNQYSDIPLKSAGMTTVVLANIVSELYRDPANSLVPFSQILTIGREKVAGRPVDHLLLSARRAAVTN